MLNFEEIFFSAKRSVYDHLPEYLVAANKLRNVLVKRHPPLKEKFGQRVISAIEQKIRKQCEIFGHLIEIHA